MIEWIPVVFVTFKVLVLGIGMFFAVKWHFDQGQKRKAMAPRAVLRAGAKVVAVFLLSLAGVALATLALVHAFHLNLRFA